MPPKPKIVNWAKSSMSELSLQALTDTGLLPAKEIISWRAPEEEIYPQPGENEVVVFADHVSRGFRPPGSKFFRDVLHLFNIRPQDLAPNSIFNLCQFQVFCEVYLQLEPSLILFRELFYLNRQTEHKDGPSIELGGISIQRRKNIIFPNAKPASHPKGWQRTWFYCKDTSPAGQNPLPGYRATRLANTVFPGLPSQEERENLEPLYPKMNALLAHGLTGADLTRTWVEWRIQPLSSRTRLMHTYTGHREDPQRFSRVNLKEKEVIKLSKKLLGETLEDIKTVGLAPFYANKPAPPVSRLRP